MPMLTQGDLQVRSAVPITDIHKFYMKIYRNIHAVFQVKGTIPEEVGEDAILQPLAGSPVIVGANNWILSAGIMKEVQMTQEGSSYHVLLTGVSAT